MNTRCNKIKHRENPNDKIYTPNKIALKAIEMADLKEGDIVLDPSYGAGVFYNNLPEYVNREWCEIDLDKDFFEYDKKVDCIIGNPPFSIWTKWLEHTIYLDPQKIIYIFGAINLTDKRVRNIISKGYGITKIHLFCVSYWFGCAFIVMFEKNKPSIISSHGYTLHCDICLKSNCKRGRKGYDFNKCYNTLV